MFVLFRYIATIEKLRDGKFRLETIESASQEIARMADDEAEIVLYHDSAGGQRGLSFRAGDSSKRDDELTRDEMIRRLSRRTVAHYFRREHAEPIYTKRPDVIVLEVSRDDRREYLITEVKNSRRRETIHQGIEETLEYLAFLRDDDEYVFKSDTGYVGSGWNGLLVIQDVEADTRTITEQDDQPIRILQASEVLEELESVVSEVVG